MYVIGSFYLKFKLKVVKFCNLERLSPNFANPSSLISLELRK